MVYDEMLIFIQVSYRFLSPYPIASMYLLYLPTFTIKHHVGKYAVRPMDASWVLDSLPSLELTVRT